MTLIQIVDVYVWVVIYSKFKEGMTAIDLDANTYK